MKAEAWYRARGRVVRPLVVALLATFIIGITALTGIQRGMDHKVMWGPWGEQHAISIALSESVYGLHLGYVGFRSVNDKLVEIWNRGASGPIDPILIENSSNADLMNEALRAAASLGPQQAGYLSDGSLITTYHDDMGEVDFYKIAFRLFGLQIQSYYYLFFAVLALSTLVYVLTFHDNIYALAALLSTLFAFYIELHLNVFFPSLPTFPGMRHGSTLGLVAMWHFVFLLDRRPSIGRVIGATIQLFILIMAWRIRGSVSWMLIFLFTMAAVVSLKHWLQRPREDRFWWGLVRAGAPWPVLALTFGIAANYVYTQVELHPIYFTDDVLPYHGAWHSAYLGLQYAPELLSPRAREALDKYGAVDFFGFYGDIDYLDRTHFIPWDGSSTLAPEFLSVWTSAWTHEMKPRFHDNIMRRAVLEAISRDPLRAFFLYAYKKPTAILAVLKSAFAGAPRLYWLWCLSAGGICGSLMFLLLDTKFNGRSSAELVLISGGTAVFAALPNLWAYPTIGVMIDLILAFVIFTLLALSLAILTVVHLSVTAHLERFMKRLNRFRRI